MANDKKTYMVMTANGDWQELAEAGFGATIWEVPDDAADRLNEDPGSLAETLEKRGRAVVDFYKNDAGELVIGGDVEQYANDWVS